MAVGLGVLRLSPADFWAMTLREWTALLAAMPPAAAPMPRGRLEAIMRRFPDG